MIEINLHPERGRKSSRKGGGSRFELPSFEGLSGLGDFGGDPWLSALLVAAVIVPLAVGGLWFLQRSEASELETRLEEARADSVRLADLRALGDSLTSRRQEIRDRIEIVQQLDRDRFVWPHLLDEVSTALPDQAWLTTLKRQAPLPDVRVQILGVAAEPLVITRFVRNLEASPYIGDVQILGSQRQTEGGVSTQSFTLEVGYTDPPAAAVRTAPLLAGGG